MLRWLGREAGRELDAGRGFLWLPVAVGAGVTGYFALPAEPWLPVPVAAAVAFAAASWVLRTRPIAFRACLVFFCVALGVATATGRTLVAGSPPVPREVTVAVTGWVAAIEDAPTRGRRLRIRVAEIADWRFGPLPRTVRVTANAPALALAVGDPVVATARLIPPSGPVFPGGFDFARQAFYGGYDAVGFSFGAPDPAPGLGPAPWTLRAKRPLARLRDAIRARIEAALPGDRGEVAAALVTGDRGGITTGTQEAMRASGLGHVLAISGLHMALVAGAAFGTVRGILALIPALALTRPIKKWAACGALAVAAGYLAISGASIATQRAFIMLSIVLVAVLLDRRAITLRNVALAALVILVMAPESVLTASFQMSFAATAALVAAYEAWRDRPVDAARTRPNRLAVFAAGLVFTSLVAGLATTPFALFHFQRIAPLSLLANVAAMPAVTVLVMPAALFGVLAMPLGLEWLPLQVMGIGLDWVTGVAGWVADLTADAGLLPRVRTLALPIFAAGFAWLLIWRRPWRLAGVAPMLAAGALAFTTPQPFLVVDRDASVVAVRANDGRYRLLRRGRESFVAGAMLRADADPRDVTDPRLDEGVRCDDLGCTIEAGDGGPLVAFATTRLALAEDCERADIIVARFPAPEACSSPDLIIDADDLDARGAHAVHRTADGYRIDTAYRRTRRPFTAQVQ